MLSAFLAQNLIERLRFAFMHFASMQGAAVLLGANSAATSFARSFFFFTLRLFPVSYDVVLPAG